MIPFVEKLSAETINQIYEGNIDAKVTMITYESLTCGHCADFHKDVYPDLKKLNKKKMMWQIVLTKINLLILRMIRLENRYLS